MRKYELTDAYMLSPNFNAFLEKAAAILGNPLMICDTNYNVEGHSGLDGVKDKAWSESIRQGYLIDELTEEVLARYRKKDLSVPDNRPFERPLKISKYLWLVSNAYFLERLQGTVNMLCLRDYDLKNPDNAAAFEELAGICAKHMHEKRSVADSRARHGELFNDLISGNISNQILMRKRIRETELGAARAFRLVSIYSENQPHSVMMALKSSIEALPFQGWLFYFDNHVLVLADAERSKEHAGLFYAGLERHLNRLGMLGCVSDEFYELLQLQVRHRKNKRALAHMRELGGSGDKALVHYYAYRYWDFVSAAAGAYAGEDIEDFMDQRVLRIREQDKLSGANNFETLFTYLLMNRSYKLAADKLFAHKNTVVYRIARLKELYGMDFESHTDCFSLLYSCVALDMYDKSRR